MRSEQRRRNPRGARRRLASWQKYDHNSASDDQSMRPQFGRSQSDQKTTTRIRPRTDHCSQQFSRIRNNSANTPQNGLKSLQSHFGQKCDHNSAGNSLIEPNKVAFFDIPIPSVLATSNNRKRLTVTVAHYPEVQRWGLESYFGSDLKWRMFRGNFDRDAVVESMSASSEVGGEDAVEVELPNEVQFEHRITLRSRGTVQHDWHDWTQHRVEYSDNHYTLAIANHKRWGRAVEPIPFAVVIRIEDLGATVPIYTEIANAIDVIIESQSRTSI